MSTTYRVKDANFILRCLCKVDGAATDVSWATVGKYIKLKRPGVGGAVVVLTATFTTDGTDGYIQATVTSQLAGAFGQWRAAPLLLGASSKRREGVAVILEVQEGL